MGRLTESMKGLREAIKRQEQQLSSFVENEHFQETSLIPDRVLSEEQHGKPSEEHFNPSLQVQLHSTESDISQVSHWSCSLDTINTSVGDLKLVLRAQDKQVCALIVENEELKNDIHKKEKELKKQKYLLKAERESFEQYKKDTFGEVRRNKSEESQPLKPNKKSQEISKLKAELLHYKQLYLEQSHSVNRLAKQVSTLKDEKLQLKEKLYQQEQRANKFILDMAHRFEISRKEFGLVVSKNFQSMPIPPTNLAVCKLTDRNARLAYDNSMLKLEVNVLKKQLIEKKTEESKLKCFTTRSASYNKTHKGIDSTNLLNKSNYEACENVNKLKSSVSENSGLTTSLYDEAKNNTQTSSSNVVQMDPDKSAAWKTFDKRTSEGLSVVPWDYLTRSADGNEVVRCSSVPHLSVSNLQD